MLNVINLGWYISAFIFGSLYISSIIFVIGAFGIAYVNDSELKLPKWFCHGPFKEYVSPIWTDKDKIIVLILYHIILGGLVSVLLALGWFVTLPILLIYLFLRLLRFSIRTKKSLATLKEQAHTHEKP